MCVLAFLASGGAAWHSPLEAQAKQELLLLLVGGVEEAASSVTCFVIVCANGLGESERAAVEQQAAAKASSPQRRRTQLVSGCRAAVLHNSVAGDDVVEQEIAVRTNDLVAEGVWDHQGAAIDNRARRRGANVLRVAGGATDPVENVRADFGVGSVDKISVASRRFSKRA